ncbi:MAG: TRAP transporter fused permease subunit [Pseudomonadota bacterium]
MADATEPAATDPAAPVVRWAITGVGLAMAVYHLWTAFFGPPDALAFRATHLGFALVLGALILPATGKALPDRPGLVALLLGAAGLAACAYPALSTDYIYNRFIYIDPLRPADWVLGVVMFVVLLETTRRAVGWALPVTALVFLVYGFTRPNVDAAVMMEQLYLSTEGIFGIPTSVSATYVMLFILFGALVERTGTGRLFMEFALSLTGHTAGGPAKVAIVTSGLFGTVSGSAVANVMTTGAFTIPMMQRIGYRPAFAGAVESVASTGGQIMPPIMGAAAFIMAEFLGVSYLTIATYALLPALLFYLAVFMAVHFEAKRQGLVGLPRSECPPLVGVLRARGHLFLPLAIVIGVLLSGYSAPFAALCGIASAVPTALLRAETRQFVNLGMIVEALVTGARNTVTVALACGCAGIVIGVITQTGLGLDFTGLVIAAARETLVIALLLTMAAGIVLGMGMPTAPAYIVQVALLVPALVQLGVAIEAAHMFVFYFAILSAITPPVALAVYAAVAISRGGMWTSSVEALKLGATGYVIPFMFVFGPGLLMIGSPIAIVGTAATAMIGVVCLAAGLIGYAFAELAAWRRLLLLAAALSLINPGIVTDLVGLACMAVALLPSLLASRARASTERPG